MTISYLIKTIHFLTKRYLLYTYLKYTLEIYIISMKYFIIYLNLINQKYHLLIYIIFIYNK